MNELVNPNNVIDNIFYDKHVRIVMVDNDPWFVAKDVADVLEHTNSRMLSDRLRDSQKGVSKVYTPYGEQEMTIINESGLYSVVIRSNKEEARKFEEWITDEVLPSIRKTGKYEVIKKSPLEIAHETLTLITTELEKANKQLEKQRPQVEFAKNVTDSINAISISEFAKLTCSEFKLGQNKMFDKLRDLEYLMINNQPYQQFIDQGLFKVIEQTFATPNGINTATKTLITGKGQVYLAAKIKESIW